MSPTLRTDPTPATAPPPTTIPTTLPPTILPTTIIPTLPRAGTGERPRPANPTLSDLMELYDPALVSLLIPGMVQR